MPVMMNRKLKKILFALDPTIFDPYYSILKYAIFDINVEQRRELDKNQYRYVGTLNILSCSSEIKLEKNKNRKYQLILDTSC